MSDSSPRTDGDLLSGSRFARFAAFLTRIVFSESQRGYRWVAALLLCIFLLAGIVQCVVGAPPITGPWDVAVLLDGGWRIVNGQIPHTDFYSPVGALTYLLIAFGMKVASPSTSSITYGVLLLAAFVIPLSWRIASTRLSWFLSLAFVLVNGFYLISPRPPGYAIRETTFAMIYNRECYVFLSLFLVCIFLKPREGVRQPPSLDGAFAGLLLALMFYCKITYFVAAAAVMVAAVIVSPKTKEWFLAAAATFAAVCAAFYVSFHVSAYRYVLDLAAAGRVQSRSMRLRLLTEGIQNNAIGIAMLLLCLGLCSWLWSRGKASGYLALRVWFAAVSIVGAALLIVSGNAAQRGGIDDPLYFVAAIVALELFRRGVIRSVPQVSASMFNAHALSLAVLVPLLAGVILFRDTASVTYSAVWDITKRPSLSDTQRIHSAALRDFCVPATTSHITGYWFAREHPARINDGIDLLRRNLQPGDRVTAIAFANPFSFALSLQPAREGPFWWDLHFSFDKSHYPPASKFLGDSPLVIVPRIRDRREGFSFETLDAMLDIYGDYLHQNFHEIDSNGTWVLYRRNQAR